MHVALSYSLLDCLGHFTKMTATPIYSKAKYVSVISLSLRWPILPLLRGSGGRFRVIKYSSLICVRVEAREGSLILCSIVFFWLVSFEKILALATFHAQIQRGGGVGQGVRTPLKKSQKYRVS